jgi:hypothetical protein
MDELARFADLKPAVPALAVADRAAIRRQVFGDSVVARPNGAATLLRLDPRGDRPGRRGRGVLTAAAAVAVMGGLGVVLVSGGAVDIVPSAPTTGAVPTTSVPSSPVAAAAEVPVPPRVLIDAFGWTVYDVYEVLAEPRADRGVVLAPTGTFPLGPWVRVTARGSATPAPVGTTPPWPDTSTVDVDGVLLTVSRMDRLTTATWSTPDGWSFSADGWDVTTDDIRSLAAGIASDGVTVTASAVPDGWEVVSPEQVAALDHDTEVHFTDGTPSVPPSTLAGTDPTGDAPRISQRTLTTRFYYGGESALRRRVAPGEGERLIVAGEDVVISQEEGGTYVRIHVIRGDWTWEVDVQDAVAVTRDEALALFARLREVDDATWTSAMPAGTVTPAMRPVVVDELLVGVPVPAGFDARPLASAPSTMSRTGVAADVAVSVACAWLDEWAVGNEAGDVARRQAAAEALADAPDWPILDEAEPGDGWDDGVLQMATVVTDPEDDASIGTAMLDEQLTACGLL